MPGKTRLIRLQNAAPVVVLNAFIAAEVVTHHNGGGLRSKQPGPAFGTKKTVRSFDCAPLLKAFPQIIGFNIDLQKQIFIHSAKID